VLFFLLIIRAGKELTAFPELLATVPATAVFFGSRVILLFFNYIHPAWQPRP